MSDEPHPRSLLDRLSDFITGEPRDREGLVEVLRACHKRGLFGPEALGIIEGALSIADMQVREAMIPRPQMVVVKASQTPADFLPLVIESAHSRFPVVDDDDPDTVLGVLLAKDLLAACFEGRLDRFAIKDYLRPPMFVPESRRLDALLRDFRQKKSHMAIVINEYGGVAGIVTIEDVLEQIVGEIEDEHDVDEEEYTIKEMAPGQWVVKALLPIEDFNEHFGTQLPDEDFDTIGGLVVQEFGRLPARDESVTIGDLVFTVLNADTRSVRLLQVTRNA
ncbi:MAG: HlyC/CorC family transporter [Gammaproteobacteria bacterium]